MKCPRGKKKKRTPRGRGKSNGYNRSMKGHTWKKLFTTINEIKYHIGRECANGCGKKHIIPEWKRKIKS